MGDVDRAGSIYRSTLKEIASYCAGRVGGRSCPEMRSMYCTGVGGEEVGSETCAEFSRWTADLCKRFFVFVVPRAQLSKMVGELSPSGTEE